MTIPRYNETPTEQPDNVSEVNEALNQVLKSLAPLTADSQRRILDTARVFFRVETGLR